MVGVEMSSVLTLQLNIRTKLIFTTNWQGIFELVGSTTNPETMCH